MKRSMPATGLFLVGFVLVGCDAHIDALRTRAAYDMRCPESKLRLTELASGYNSEGVGAVYGVDGCGKRGTYVQPAAGTWVLNSESGGNRHEESE